VGLGIIAQDGRITTKSLGRVSAEACEKAVHLYYPNIGTKKDPQRGLVFVINKGQIIRLILPFGFGMFCPFNP
jgi:hypothetical protein